MCHICKSVVDWANSNQGFIALSTFLAAALFGWVSGIFNRLRFTPRIVAKLLAGPNFFCIILTDKQDKDISVYRIAISAYLKIFNMGNAPTSLSRIEIGIPLQSGDGKVHTKWLRLTITLSGFKYSIGDKDKIYPLLFQVDNRAKKSGKTYLRPGETTNGIAYFEEEYKIFGRSNTELVQTDRMEVKAFIRISDGYGNEHRSTISIPITDIETARECCSNFGKTLDDYEESDLDIR